MRMKIEASEKFASVGIGCRTPPNASSLNAFWRLLLLGGIAQTGAENALGLAEILRLKSGLFHRIGTQKTPVTHVAGVFLKYSSSA